jgi:ABC-type sugar transport system permease subunit
MLIGILVVLAGILGVITQGWAIVVLMFYPHVWIPVVILGAVLGWIFRRNFGPEPKEKSE